MSKTSLFAVTLFLFTGLSWQHLHAQNANPFESIGKKAEVVTLSKGKFVEVIENDSIQRVGCVLININTKTIVGFLDEDSLLQRSSDNSEASRWYSLDPKANERDWLSPYNFVQNNPILKIDPDGALDGDYYDVNHNYLGNDGIDDNRVYVVNTTRPAGVDQSLEGGPSQVTITYVGQTNEVFKTGDNATDQKIATLHPAIRWQATDFVNQANSTGGDVKIRIAQGLRTFEEQDALYAKGRTAPGDKVTNAKGGYSNHNFGLAFDVAGIDKNGSLTYDLNYPQLKEIGQKNGLQWGGDWKTFKDKPHFENMFGKTLGQLRALYNSGQRKGPYVNIK